MLLEVKDLNISYGDKLTVSDVNLERIPAKSCRL